MTLIYIVAGEASGDLLGGRLMAALRQRRPDLRFAGIGGERMAAEGLESLFPMRELALMGLAEVLPKLRALARRMDETEADITRRQPALLITIDAPSFTLRLAGRARRHGIRCLHYVAPQVWAWRPGRVKKLARRIDSLLALLPFEPLFFEAAGIPVRFVGHPILESDTAGGDGPGFRAAHGIGAQQKLLLVMPGSRQGEVQRLLPIFGEAVKRLAAQGICPRIVVPVAGPVAEAVRRGTAQWPQPPILVSTPGDKRDAFAAADAGLIKSGTSSLEMAVAGVPHVVAYRVNPLTAAIVRRLLKVPYASLVNLLAGREVVPEKLQEHCTAPELAAALVPLLQPSPSMPDSFGSGRTGKDPAENAAAEQRAAFAAILAQLAPANGLRPSEAAAEAVLECLAAGR